LLITDYCLLQVTAKRVIYEGRVQGVGFRFSVKEIAHGYDVAGWVRNLPDGRVQLEAQGDEPELDGFLQAIEDSHLRAHIRRKVVTPIEPTGGLKGFQIRA
jgi:acylphosphatase